MLSKKKLSGLLVLFAFLVNVDTSAQKSKFWGRLEPGKYTVGYFQQTVFNKKESYQYGVYKGPKPFFIGVWVPLEQPPKSPALKFSEYFEFDGNPTSIDVRDSLVKFEMDMLAGEICSNRATMSEIPFGKGEKALLQKILDTETPAYPIGTIPSTKFPVVIYHHGAGSISQDNTVMFEYLASHGYVVVSSNYHLPLKTEEGSEYGSKDYNGVTDVAFVTGYAKLLPCSDPQRFYYSGHSWGAGTGLRVDEKGKHPFKKFVLLESTIEDYSWEAIKQLWPNMDSLLRNHANHFKTPTWLITAPKDYYEEGTYVLLPPPAFVAFKAMPSITKINCRVPMNHDSFVSIGPMKQVYAQDFFQPDAMYTKRELESFYDVTELVLKILEGKEMDEGRWVEVK